ncbi:hypothetical protein HZS38_03695 [Xenorhabdus nematophila]|uniref:YejG-like protein n=1 Tax=Xenorhabdus nematophila (strain ATCC 19061 / DSM 3370 / CCUG 14189 / LMG 1036 / NCIMB 9965 / AN6) TaxID=406817 RepID=D3VKU3_XENNA|nr:YejG family protein [Xenorhabdus nematophila]CEE90435.1 conserved hypothetical protein [Xenorhabdus nematophila str. Anatoliense]CEF28524.1 conserved hypothetical protein [Xenorhabdus nematophila str. Websteri]AYA39763.1 hypothetical protein D3790_04120 [Xenorhabdus nematophila]KHD27757.1 hypothetical protein LH67_15740 [Xenorhabdus nematophila]MBA0018330.1 hypothetical protein [Xenorhabdus nematophila]
MNNIQLSVVHRLPQSYRWSSGFVGTKVEVIPAEDTDTRNSLTGLKLLSHEGEKARDILHDINQSIADMQILSAVIEWEGESCLFFAKEDESAVMCRLKTLGAAIAENITAFYPL